MRVLICLLLLCQVIWAMDEKKKQIQARPIFEIFAHMNSLDLSSRNKCNIADFGEKVGYLLYYPLEHWKVPLTDVEEKIAVQWLKKLYAEKSGSILEPMIEQLLAKIIKHQEWHDFIMKSLLDEEDESIVVDLRFKKLDYEQQQYIENKQPKWGSCIIL